MSVCLSFHPVSRHEHQAEVLVRGKNSDRTIALKFNSVLSSKIVLPVQFAFRNVSSQCPTQMKELVLEFEVLSQRIPAGGSIQSRVEIRFFG